MSAEYFLRNVVKWWLVVKIHNTVCGGGMEVVIITERPPRFQIRRPLQTTEHSVYYYQYIKQLVILWEKSKVNWNKTDIGRRFPHASTNWIIDSDQKIFLMSMNRQFFKDMKNGNKMLISKKYIFICFCQNVLYCKFIITISRRAF